MSRHSLGAGRLESARRQYRHCLLCERRCGVDRIAGERGACKAGAAARVYRQRVECGEEIELIPSHLFYLSGCNIACSFCIGGPQAFEPQQGQLLTPSLLADWIIEGRARGARNIQWVGGEPTIHLPAILDAMAGCGEESFVVWKSNFVGTIESFALLEGAVDVYVADFKFGNDLCARRIAGMDRYMQTVARNLLLAATQARLIVRHLLLPGHFDCCYRPIVEWMHRCLPATPFRVMPGYLPRWQASRHEELIAPLEPAAGGRAIQLAREKGLAVID